MTPAATTLQHTARHYRLPALLHDIRLLDLLELSGTTVEASRWARLSQPTVSRRVRSLLHDFDLIGCRHGADPTMLLLRLSCRAHRLAAGVARLGADVMLQPLLLPHGWLLPTPPRFRVLEGWLELVGQGVLDGALVSGLEGRGAPSASRTGLEVVPLGDQPLALAIHHGAETGSEQPCVLVPSRLVAQGLRQGLLERGLMLRSAGNTCQTSGHWLQRLDRSGLAMALPQLEPAAWWAPLQQLPLPEPMAVPVELVLPVGWQRQPVLARTVRQLRARLAGHWCDCRQGP